MAIGKSIFLFLVLFLVLCPSAWSGVFIHWSTGPVPSASSLGVSDIVFSWKPGIAPQLAAARNQGYRVYVDTTPEHAKQAAEEGTGAGWTGLILEVPESDRNAFQDDLDKLRSAYPKLRFLALNPRGKQPDMRGSLIIKRDSVLEVSSPTAQPWIDTNLALIRVERRAQSTQIPLYTFSWSDPAQPRALTGLDYSLAVAEAGAFHADLVLQLDEHLQQGLSQHDPEARALWNQVRSVLSFLTHPTAGALAAASNVAAVVDHLDPGDEVLNLLSRHNIPFQVFLAEDLRTAELEGVDILIVFARPDRESVERINSLAAHGTTVVLVDAHDRFPWQSSQRDQLNEHTTSYAVGSGRVLELSEAVTDPETFAQDIRRLLGKRNAVLSLWNGLTTIAVPYQEHDGSLRVIEFVNYAGDPVRVQVQVKGWFTSIRYESPEHGCCESLAPVKHDGFTEFVIPQLGIAGRVHLQP
jgi:hypothetical protein